jgi:hypothetical protein
MQIPNYNPNAHFHYETQIPWPALAEELGVTLAEGVPIGYNWPQRWNAKLVRTDWKFYPRLTDGRCLEVAMTDDAGTLCARVLDPETLAGTIHEPVFPRPETIAAGIKRMIHRLNEIVVIAGGVHLKLLNSQTYPDPRNRPEDPGPELSVYCNVPGQGWLSGLRFCCLERDPHMHLGPGREAAQREPGTAGRGDPIGWMVREMSTHVVELLSEAGYPEFARTVDQRAIAVAMREIEQAFRIPGSRK